MGALSVDFAVVVVDVASLALRRALAGWMVSVDWGWSFLPSSSSSFWVEAFSVSFVSSEFSFRPGVNTDLFTVAVVPIRLSNSQSSSVSSWIPDRMSATPSRFCPLSSMTPPLLFVIYRLCFVVFFFFRFCRCCCALQFCACIRSIFCFTPQ